MKPTSQRTQARNSSRISIATLVSSALVVFAASSAPAQTWTRTSAPVTNWSAIAISADGTRLVAATPGFSNWPAHPPTVASGVIVISDDSGATWQQRVLQHQGYYPIEMSADGTKVFAAAHSIGDIAEDLPVWLSRDAGATWTNTFRLTNFFWFDLAASSDGTQVAAVTLAEQPGGRNCYISRDSGVTWELSQMLTVRQVAWAANGERLAAATAGGFFCSKDGGRSWASGSFTNVQSCFPLVASADGTMLAATLSPGLIYLSRDWGKTWSLSGAPVKAWTRLAASADGMRLAGIASGREPIFVSFDAGATWTTNGAPAGHWTDVTMSADGCRIVAVDRGEPEQLWWTGGGMYIWQTIPRPLLEASFAHESVSLSWLVPSRSFVLQESPTLTPGDWANVSAELTLNHTNLHYEVTLPKPVWARFYRLSLE